MCMWKITMKLPNVNGCPVISVPWQSNIDKPLAIFLKFDQIFSDQGIAQSNHVCCAQENKYCCHKKEVVYPPFLHTFSIVVASTLSLFGVFFLHGDTQHTTKSQ